MRTVRLPGMQIALMVVITGGFAVLFALTALHRKYVFILFVFVAQIVTSSLVARQFQNDVVLLPKGSELHAQLQLLGTGGIIALVAGYTCFLFFSTREGERFFALTPKLS